jgi:hypothetical protein
MDENDDLRALDLLIKTLKPAPRFRRYVLEERDGRLEFVRDKWNMEFEEAFNAALDAAYGLEPPTPDE